MASNQLVRKEPVWSVWAIAALMLGMLFSVPSESRAQGNFVYVNNQATQNSISGYSVSPAGALTAVPGSPFLTGGSAAVGTCYGLDRIVASSAGNLLFVANNADMTISVFQIDPATGGLT